MPTNHIPKGLIPLEKPFDHNYVSIKLQLAETNEELEDFNLGIELEKRYVKLSKSLSEERKIEYHKLFLPGNMRILRHIIQLSLSIKYH